MFKLFVFSILWLLSLSAWAALEIEINFEDDDPVASVQDGVSGNGYFNIVVDELTGDTSSTNPIHIYIPIKADGTVISGEERIHYSTINDGVGSYVLPSLSSDSGVMKLKSRLTNSEGETRHLMAAVKQDDGEYRTFKLSEATPSVAVTTGTDNSLKELLIDFSCTTEHCFNQYADIKIPTNSNSNNLIYLFYTNDSNVLDYNSSLANPSDYQGLYLELNFSNAIYNGVSIDLITLAKGDMRLKAKYDSSGYSSSLFYKTFIFKYDSTASTELGQTKFSTLSPGSIWSYHNPQYEAEITIKNLINGISYNFAVGFVDKYRFMSALSASEIEIPLEIAPILEKTSCYLVSAGFKKEHVVLNYFREIRDEILLKSYLGRMFVQWYYHTAPHYALIIYNSDFLSFITRAFSYFIYYLLNFCIYPVIFIIFGYAALKLRKRIAKSFN